MSREVVYIIVAIVVIRAILCALVYAFREKVAADFFNDGKVVKAIKKLIIEAEKYYTGTKEGQKRLEWVAERVWRMLPSYVRPYVNNRMIKRAIEIIFEQIAVHLDDGRTVPMWDGE